MHNLHINSSNFTIHIVGPQRRVMIFHQCQLRWRRVILAWRIWWNCR